MSLDPKQFPKAMAAVLTRARAYLQDEVGLAVTRARPTIGNMDALQLRAVTAVVCTGGPVKLLIAFSFERRLLEWLREQAIRSIEVAPSERDLFLRETAAETANFILGHATADLAEDGNDVTLSPPVVISEGRRILRPKKAMFATIELSTSYGIVDLDFIGPMELFDRHLNVLDG